MPIDLGRAKEIFLASLEMPAAERKAYLDAACNGDNELRQRIEAMLHSQEASGELLPRSPAEMLANGSETQAEQTAAFGMNAETSKTFDEHGASSREGISYMTPSTDANSLGRLNHYEILEEIGKGGFGTVFKARDTKLQRIVAIKVLAAELAANGSARKRFIREAQAAAAVKNEHVVAIYNVEDEHQPPYIVMEIIDGISLQDLLDKNGPLNVKEILRIGMQIAEGLAAAHKQGLIHRDIKPANILLENGVQRVKITDFGLARLGDDASITQSGVIAGTPMYMAPEQAMGGKLDHRADLFSLGSLLYALCTGRGPFRAANTMAVLKRVCEETPRPIREINNEIPDWLCDIITKLHAKQPAERYQTAREVADVLGEQLADLQFTGRASAGRAEGRKAPVEAPATMIAPAPVANASNSFRKRALLAAASLGILVLAAILAVNYWPHEADVPNPPEKQPPVVQVADNDGWVPLFNGKDLTGWTTGYPKSFKVENGELVCQKFGYMGTTASFRDFHFRIEAKANAEAIGNINVRDTGVFQASALIGTKQWAKVGSLQLRNNQAVTSEILTRLRLRPTRRVVIDQ